MGIVQRAPTAFAAGILATATVALMFRNRPVNGVISLFLAVGSPYAALLSAVGVVIAVSLRHVLLSVLAVAVAAASLGVQFSWYHGGHPRDVGSHVEIRVLSSNVRNGEADAASFVKLAEAEADVIMVAELTPQAAQSFSRHGISRTFPHAVLMPEAGAVGIGMWSRFPLTAVPVPKRRSIATPAARLRIPGVRFDPLLAAVHVDSPVADRADNIAEWRSGLAGVQAQLDRFAALAGRGAVIVGGDFNSTPDIRQFRDLLTDGYQDAANQVGAGFTPTFPAGGWFPPLITIDHVLTRNAVATSFTAVAIEASDHRGLVATIRVPLTPTRD
jgi:endonuclease/exonuclease/phosphatase (EEP) superfamily protein YafD